MAFLFEPAARPAVPIVGSDALFPVHRIYCVGKNYADHVKEMGGDPKTEPPVFFSKPADAIVTGARDVRYPLGTENLHFEVELVLALAEGGENIGQEEALSKIYGYALGIDFTRRDLQDLAKSGGRPWDTAKGFDDSAPLSAIVPVSAIGHPAAGRISLAVNGELRQDGNLNQLIWSVGEIISSLSSLYCLQAGDLIFTGTPAGVGPTVAGDRLSAAIEGVAELDFRVV